MLSPRILTQLILGFAAVYLAVFCVVLFYPPYTGFNIALNSNGQFQVVRADNWVSQQGLETGDIITGISSRSGQEVVLEPRHYPSSSTQSRTLHGSVQNELVTNSLMNQILSDSPITVNTLNGEQITLQLEHMRPPGSLNWEVWACMILSVLCWLFPALVWAWRPRDLDILYITLSGFGLGLATISAATEYQMEMYFAPGAWHYLIFILVGFGNFMAVIFAAACFMYFPQKLPFARPASLTLFFLTLLYTAITFFDSWNASLPWSQQFFYFEYNEVYLVEIIGYLLMLTLCFVQWWYARNKPLATARAQWILFASVLSPLLFFLFYLVPVLSGQEAILSRTWTTAIMVIALNMIVIGVSNLKVFSIEKYIGVIYQWTFISLLFFCVDAVLIFLANFSTTNATILTTALTLWVYLPARQWIQSRINRKDQIHYQNLFSTAAGALANRSLQGNLDRAEIAEEWKRVLSDTFHPLSIHEVEPGDTAIVDHGQALQVAANRYSHCLHLYYADSGARLFLPADLDLVVSLNRLFIRLYENSDDISRGQLIERNRIRRDLHDQIGHNLLSLIYAVNDDKCRQLAQETLAQLSDIMQALKLKPTPLNLLVSKIYTLCDAGCEHAGIKLVWHDSTEIQSDAQVTSDQYINILNIVREGLNNTLKHAAASRFTVTLSIESLTLAVVMADDGCGFDMNLIKPGNGLYNIQTRAEEMQASANWTTGNGTHLALTVPLAGKENRPYDGFGFPDNISA